MCLFLIKNKKIISCKVVKLNPSRLKIKQNDPVKIFQNKIF